MWRCARGRVFGGGFLGSAQGGGLMMVLPVDPAGMCVRYSVGVDDVFAN